MSKFKVTYEIGDNGNPDVICTRLIEADDADLAVVSLRNETWEGTPLYQYIMFRVTKVERV